MLSFPPKPWVNGQTAYLVPSQLYIYDSANNQWDYIPKAVLDSDFEVDKAIIDSHIDSETARIQNIQIQVDNLALGLASELDSEIHDRLASDSEIGYRISIILNDHDSDLVMAYHDFRAADSDLYVAAVGNTAKLDSEILARKSADSDLRSEIVSIIDNLRNEKDSDDGVTRGDHDSDLTMSYHDFRAADSDLYVAAVGNTEKLDSEILARKSADSDLTIDLVKEVHDRIASDSDLSIDAAIEANLRSKADSDLAVDLVKETHDRTAADSDISVVIIHDKAGHDSDILRVTHDYLAADSDLYVAAVGNTEKLDSEILARKSADSDLQVLVDALLARTDSDSIILQDVQSQIDLLISNADSDVIEIAQLRRDADSDSIMIQKLKGDADSDASAIAKIRSELDSDVSSLEALWRDLDSERVTRGNEDSDLWAAINGAGLDTGARLDSEIHDRRAADSEILLSLDSEVHDRKAGDSEILAKLDSEVLVRKNFDSDLRAEWDSEKVWFEDQVTNLWSEFDSEVQVIRDFDSDVRVEFRRDYDSDINKLYGIDSDLRHDVDSDLTNRTLNGLADVSIDYAPVKGTILSWDSDSETWTAQDLTVTAAGSTHLKVDTYVATEGQTTFNLTHFPAGDATVYRNGLTIPTGSYALNGKEITYYPVHNFDSAIDSEDDIRIVYNRSTNIAFAADLNDLSDVDTSTVLPRDGWVLVWDSDNQVFAPASTADEADLRLDEVESRLDSDESALQFHNTLIVSNVSRIAQLEADLDSETTRVQELKTTVSALQTQITDNDSDIGVVGFTVIGATQPTGQANMLWLNTNNGRLYWYNTVGDVFIELTTGA